MIFSDFLKAVAQLSDRRFLGVVGAGVGLTVLLLLGFYALFVGVVGWFVPETLSLPVLGEVTWVDNAISFAAIPLMLLLSMVLMVPVASAFTGLFLEQIADAVEAEHYPHLPPARAIGILEGLTDGLKFLGVMLAANTVALILYITPLAPFVFWGLNGYLLAREYAQMVALRRGDMKSAKSFRRRHFWQIWAAGVMMAVPLTIPVVNLLVPVLGAATFTHLYHRTTGSGGRVAWA